MSKTMMLKVDLKYFRRIVHFSYFQNLMTPRKLISKQTEKYLVYKIFFVSAI